MSGTINGSKMSKVVKIKATVILSSMFLLTTCLEKDDNSNIGKNLCQVVFPALCDDIEATKTQVSEVNKILWTPGDAITVFYGDNKTARFVSDNSSPAKKVNFRGKFEGLDGFPDDSGNLFWAVYPYREDNFFDGEKVSLYLPDVQRATPDSFEKETFPSIGRSRESFRFLNICGGVVFTVQHEGICRVVFKGNEGEPLAGRLNVGFNAYNLPEVSEVIDAKSEIELLAPEGETLKKNKWYYIVTSPITLSKGYTMEFYRDEKIGERKNEKKVVIKRNCFGVLASADNITVEISEPDAIDMGMSVKWASSNVGAKGVEDVGNLYAWGEIIPKNSYSFENYKWVENSGRYNKYGTGNGGINDEKIQLDFDDDAASLLLGQVWRMPTKGEIEELCHGNSCSWEEDEINGVSGFTVRSNGNGNSIFIPRIYDGFPGVYTPETYYWSSSLCENDDSRSYCLLLSSYRNVQTMSRYQGFPIRPVMDYIIRIEGMEEIVVSPDEQEKEITVFSTDGAKLISCPDWISHVSSEKQNQYTTAFTLKVSSNLKSTKRKGVVQFTNNHGDIAELSVIQEQVEARLNISNNSYYFNCMGGERELVIDTNRDWTISVSEPWCTLSSTNGSYSSTLIIRVDSNSSSSERDAVVKVKSVDGSLDEVVINIRQGGIPHEDIDWSAPFSHKSLAMLFISTREGESFRIIEGCDGYKQYHPDKIELINIQKSGSLLETEGANVLVSRYGVSGPSAIIDGRELVEYKLGPSGYPIVASLISNAVYRTEQSYPKVFSTIAYQSSLSGRMFKINEQIYCKEASSYRVSTLLIEDNVICEQVHTRLGTDRTFNHNNVVRSFLSDISGDQIITSSGNSVVSLSYTYEIPGEYNVDNMRVVIFVEKVFGDMPVVTTGVYGEYYVDNCISGKIGSSQSPAIIKGGNGGTEDFGKGDDINW